MPDAQASTVPRTDATPPSVSEDALDARSAAMGDRMAFARLYERHGRMVHAIALVRVDLSEAEDVTHEAFMRAMKSIGMLKDGEAVGPWLARIARNAAIDYAKSRSRWRWLLRSEPKAEASIGESQSKSETSGEGVLLAIRSLPEAYQETLVLRLVEQMTGPQIAVALGMTPGSVRVNLHRGMELLRTQLGVWSKGGGA